MRNTYLVCYDKRLRRVFQTMRDLGDHLQYSVFECQFTAVDCAPCRHLLSEIIDHRRDQVLFINLGPKAAAIVSSPPSASLLAVPCALHRGRRLIHCARNDAPF